QSAPRHHAQPVEYGQDAGRIERGRRGVGRGRRHAARARHRRRRIGAHSVLPHRPRRHQGAVRPHPGMAAFGRTLARPRRAEAALMFTATAGYGAGGPATLPGPVPDLVAACEAGARGLRVAYSRTLGFAKPDADVVAIIDKAAKTFESLGCIVETVEDVFSTDPVDVWNAEFYGPIGPRISPLIETHRDMFDPVIGQT